MSIFGKLLKRFATPSSNDVALWFKHNNSKSKFFKQDMPEGTLCRVTYGSKTFEGMSHKNPNDVFSKSYGRKIALRNTLKNANLSKDVRVKIWEKYWSDFAASEIYQRLKKTPDNCRGKIRSRLLSKTMMAKSRLLEEKDLLVGNIGKLKIF